MLIFLQTTFLLVLAVAIACFSTWQYFRGNTWWLAAAGGLLAYAALLSVYFLGSPDAWHRKAIQFVFNIALSNVWRATISSLILLGITLFLAFLAFNARPADTGYYEVRVYDNVDLPTNYHIGARITLHTRTDGLTHVEAVGNDGGAVFRSLVVPTTVTYQIEVVRSDPPFITAGNDTIERLPRHLAIDTTEIPDEKRLPLAPEITTPAIVSNPRPTNYLLNVDERGNENLQTGNAPWGVPRADLVLNRLGYALGYDLERKMPRWVAYSIGPTEQIVPRGQDFVADPAISADKQARISDYRGSGYDRGHMISPADLFFKGPVTVEEAFYMSTVTPQSPWLNRRLWKDLEVRVRDTIRSRQQLAFVIAGPLFIESQDDPSFEFDVIGERRISVPTHFFRIMTMMTPQGGIDTFGVIVPNADDGSFDLTNYLVPISEIEQKSGLNFFPLLDPRVAMAIKADVAALW